MATKLTQLREERGNPPYRSIYRDLLLGFGDLVTAETIRGYHTGATTEERANSLLVAALAHYYRVDIREISEWHAEVLGNVRFLFGPSTEERPVFTIWSGPDYHDLASAA